jgi:hypothetical protein
MHSRLTILGQPGEQNMASMLQSGFPSGFMVGGQLSNGFGFPELSGSAARSANPQSQPVPASFTAPGFPPGFLIGSQLAGGFGFPDLSASQTSQAASPASFVGGAQPQLFSSTPAAPLGFPPIGGQLSGGFGFPDLSGWMPSTQASGFASQPSLFGGSFGAFPGFLGAGQTPPLLMNFGAPVGTSGFAGSAQNAGVPSFSASMFGPPVGSVPSFGSFGEAFQFPFMGASQQASVVTPFGNMPALFSNIQSPLSGISSPAPSPFFGSLPSVDNMFGSTTQSLMQMLSPMLSLVGIR